MTASAVRAEGGGSDRAQMTLFAQEPQERNEGQAAPVSAIGGGRAGRARIAAPVPPRRPVEAASVSAQPFVSSASAQAPAQTSGGASSSAGTQPQALASSGTSNVPASPHISAPVLGSERFTSSGTTPTEAANGQDIQTASGKEAGGLQMAKAPLPPQRPTRRDNADAADMELASLPQTQQRLRQDYQAQPVQVASADTRDGDSGSPGFFQRLFSAPPSSNDNAMFGGSARVRPKSRLNHIIGDDPQRASQLRALISKHAAENGLPFKFADAVVRVESRYNSRARNGPYIGLMQIHPRTAQSLGYSGDAAGLFDPDTNLRYGVKYLAMAYRLAGGDTCGTVMRYQGGHRAASMTKANHAYCSKVKMIFSENQ